MSTISYNIDSFYNDSFFREIEEICNKPYRFYREIELFFKTIEAKRIVKKTEKLNLSLISSLYEFDFARVMEIERRIKEILESLSSIANACSQCEYTRCKERYSDIYIIPLIVSFENLLKSIQNSYHLNADNIFKTDDEYKENNEALKAFADIWDDEPTIEEEEFVFKHNVETNIV
jgi:hypothetical protein